MAERTRSLARNLGEFVGHIARALRTDPGRRKTTLRLDVDEARRGDVILRRTTIDEIEIRPDPAEPDPAEPDPAEPDPAEPGPAEPGTAEP